MIFGNIVRGFWNTVTYVGGALNPFNSTVRKPLPRTREETIAFVREGGHLDEKLGPASRTRSILDLSGTELPSVLETEVEISPVRSKPASGYSSRYSSTSYQSKTAAAETPSAWYKNLAHSSTTPVAQTSSKTGAVTNQVSSTKTSGSPSSTQKVAASSTTKARSRKTPERSSASKAKEQLSGSRARSRSRGRPRGSSTVKEPPVKKVSVKKAKKTTSAGRKSPAKKESAHKSRKDTSPRRLRLRSHDAAHVTPTEAAEKRKASSSSGPRKHAKHAKVN